MQQQGAEWYKKETFLDTIQTLSIFFERMYEMDGVGGLVLAA